MMSNLARILVADDEPDLIDDYRCALAIREPSDTDLHLTTLQDELFGPQHSAASLPQVEIIPVNQGEAAVQAIARARDQGQPFAAAFIDVRMPPGMNGLDAAMKIRELDEQLPIVIVTAFTDIQTIDLAKKIPPADRLFVVQKPFHTTEIQQLAIALTARRELERASLSDSFMADSRNPRQFEELVSSLPGGVALYDADKRLVRTNGELENLFPDMKQQLTLGSDYDALRDSISKRILSDRVVERATNTLTEGNHGNGGIAARRLVGGRWMIIAERPQVSGASVVQFLDITAMKAAEQRRLVDATMTHVSRFVEGLVEKLEAGSRHLGPVGDSTGADELSKTLRALLDDLTPVAQRQDLSPRPAILDGLINEVIGEIAPRVSQSVNLEMVSAVGLWPVFVDSEQIKRVLDALIRNAVEALKGGGTIYVEALNVRAGREATLELPGLKPGDYVCVRITDNGSGMSPEIISRAFMPYFTTKDPKIHRGMGLTTAYSLVMQSGGHFYISSDGHSETQVRLFFPRTPLAPQSKKCSISSH